MSENNKFSGILTSVKNVAEKVSEKAASAAEEVKNTAIQLKALSIVFIIQSTLKIS